MFETTEPVSEPRTTFGRLSATASRAMISSGALPKLAFRNPPTPGPVCSAACSVASPISQASGIKRTRREHEELCVAEREDVAAEQRDRGERQERPQDPPQHDG